MLEVPRLRVEENLCERLRTTLHYIAKEITTPQGARVKHTVTSTIGGTCAGTAPALHGTAPCSRRVPESAASRAPPLSPTPLGSSMECIIFSCRARAVRAGWRSAMISMGIAPTSEIPHLCVSRQHHFSLHSCLVWTCEIHTEREKDWRLQHVPSTCAACSAAMSEKPLQFYDRIMNSWRAGIVASDIHE